MFLGLLLFSIVVVVLLFWVAGLTIFIFKAYHVYRQMTADIDKKDVAEVLSNIKKQAKSHHQSIDDLTTRLDALNLELKPYIQKVGFVRYNPFGNTGGDQSFCLCLLDDRGNGILLTSLHARQQTRIYTKEILDYKSKEETQLTKEEQKCIKIAQKWSK